MKEIKELHEIVPWYLIDDRSLDDIDILFDADINTFLGYIKDAKRPQEILVILNDSFSGISMFYDTVNKTYENHYPLNITTNNLLRCIIQMNKYTFAGDGEQAFKYKFLFSGTYDDLYDAYQKTYNMEFRKKHMIHNEINFCEMLDAVDCRVSLEQDLFSQFRTRAKRHIKKAIKNNVEYKIYGLDNDTLLSQNDIIEFVECCENSRKNLWGSNGDGKSFISHNNLAMISMRNLLLKKKKMFFVRTAFENKITWITVIYNKINSLYYDTGYSLKAHPMTSYYAQYIAMKNLQELNCKSYSVGLIQNKEHKSECIKNSRDSVDYFKAGFCKQPSKVFYGT